MKPFEPRCVGQSYETAERDLEARRESNACRRDERGAIAVRQPDGDSDPQREGEGSEHRGLVRTVPLPGRHNDRGADGGGESR